MNSLVLLLLGHAIGDFYLQSNGMAKDKSKYFTKHIFIYTFVQATILFVHYRFASALFLTFLVSISHVIIDKLSIFVQQEYTEKSKVAILVPVDADPILHILHIVP